MIRIRTAPLGMTLALLLVGSVAFAQDTLPGVPAEYQAVVATAITVLSGALTWAFTAVAKRLGRTSGVTTVAVSAVVSLVVVMAIHLIQAAMTRGTVPLGAALAMAALAFIQANGIYIAGVFARMKATGGDALPLDKGGEGGLAAQEYVPGLEAAPALLGLPTTVTALAGSLLGSSMLEGIVKALLQAAGLPAGAGMVLAVGARLAPMAPDLFDGDPQLDTSNLATLNRVILDLKAEHLGGTA